MRTASRDRIQTRTAAIQNRKARIERERKARAVLLRALIGDAVTRHRAGTAVNGNGVHVQRQSRSGRFGSASLSRLGRARAAISLRAAIWSLALFTVSMAMSSPLAQIAGAEAARCRGAAHHERIVAVVQADDDELEVVLVGPEPGNLVVDDGVPRRLNAALVPCSNALSTDSRRTRRP
jgi:hypothetical protein